MSMNSEIIELNLESVVFTLVDDDGYYKWPLSKALEVEKWYRRFLYISSVEAGVAMVPSKDIDVFWHEHILDTRKYFDDCERVFGRYFHHFPFFGTRGKQDEADLRDAYVLTNKLYLKYFNEMPSKGDLDASVCGGDDDGGSCGGGECGGDVNKVNPKFNERPNLSNLR